MTSPKPAHETMPNWPPSSWNGGRDQIVIGGRLRWNPHAACSKAVKAFASSAIAASVVELRLCKKAWSPAYPTSAHEVFPNPPVSRQSPSLDAFNESFAGRLHALAQAHNLLVEKEWVGADIAQIVAEVLAPYRTDDTTHIIAEGPKLTVRPQIGVALMMILHELATNALKYGALSVPTGTLLVSWHREGAGTDERIHVRWSETGGPKVKPPTWQGFGTKLIERSTAHELGGEARLEYLEEGLRAELIF